ncbi:MAG: RNase J family beta-CASP ribonuclease [Eubacterium sp.]|nr:RNase J family beta-CASP ribonuclease [Eubacterium sp.]
MNKVEQKNQLSDAEKQSAPARKPLRNKKKKNPFAKEFKLSDSRSAKSAEIKSFKLSRPEQPGKKPVLRDRYAQDNAQPPKKPVLRDRYAQNKEQQKPVKENTQRHDNHAKPEHGHENAERAHGKKTPVRVFALGGLNEIGKNLYVYECANDMFIIDCGLAFPDEDMLGVDLVIPDFTYLEKNREHFRGIILTHGHEDHIGALPYLLKKVNVPVYGTRLTLGLVEGKLKEHGILSQCSLNVVTPKQHVKMGCMSVEFIRVNHSIPDACALAVHTPAGIIVHTGDFKVDYTPIEGGIIDLARFGELGNKGVLALLSESTNAERPGYTATERKVGESFRSLFAGGEGKRIIVATFSSNIHRVQQIINCAAVWDRKVAVSGRSMLNVLATARELNYIKVPDGMLVDIEEVNNYPPEKMVIITTGSQGEPLSALSRMSSGDHRQVSITPQDLIIISATPIPGNEKFVGKLVNELMKQGAEVVYEAMYEVHVSGHACQDELKMMLALTKPKFFIPIHGEYKHLKKHQGLAIKMGIPEDNIFLLNLGQVVETDGTDMAITTQVQSGRVLVDGLGVGDVGSVVLRDRKHLAEDGLIAVVTTINRESGEVIAGPDIVSRGFVYVRESEELIDEAKQLIRKTLNDCSAHNIREWGNIKSSIKDELGNYIYQKTKRSPMILPIIMEV